MDEAAKAVDGEPLGEEIAKQPLETPAVDGAPPGEEIAKQLLETPAVDGAPPGEEIAKQLLEDEDGGPPANDKDEDAGGDKGGEEREKPSKGKTLEQMMSLKEGDDERTQISKKVSWILRHGAHKVNIDIDIDGWVTFADLLGSAIMIGVTEEKMMDIIDESNQQKVRYELKDKDEHGLGGAIRAVSKHTISGMTGTVAREQRRAEREVRRETRQDDRRQERNSPEQSRGADPNDGEDLGRTDPAGQSGSWPGGRGGYDAGRQEDDGDLSYDQQLREGYRPVYQGHRVVAMVKEGGAAIKPGRGVKGASKGDSQKGDYKGDSKGYGKGDEKGYDRGGYGGYGNNYGGGGDYQRNDWGSKGGKDRGKGGYRDVNSRNEETFGPQDYGGKDYGGKDRRDYGGNDRRDFGGKYGGKGYEDAYNDRPQERYPPPNNPRELWRVCEGQEAIMRAGEAMESQAITALGAGTLVYQTGPEVTNQHGIIRMPVETYDNHEHGWVTRTAEAAHGPAFFRREPSGKGARQAGKGGKGKGGHEGW